MKRARSAAYWAIPLLFCLTLYWPGVKCWFRQDDFAWLKLTLDIYSWRDFWHALLAPMAQGTFRPWGERAFFMVFYTLFGLDALPFRIWVFLTQFGNLTLINAITRRVTGSPVAGVCAALLWTANASLVVVMTWTSVYNEALCGFFLLLAFYCLLRYIDTGDPRWWRAQWIVFLLGFGALELNVVYPALAAAYTLLCARTYFRKTLPLFLPSLLFIALHRLFIAPKVPSPSYVMSFDASMLKTLWAYFQWALGPDQLSGVVTVPDWVGQAGTVLLTAGLAGFTVLEWRRGRKLPVFFLAWFVILIAPVLPLRKHITDYYTTLSAIGLAMFGGYALVSAWRSGWAARAAAAILALVYLGTSLLVIRIEVRQRYQLSRRIQRLVLGVARAAELHPGQTILLNGVDDELFWNGIVDSPFRLLGAASVYLAPEAAGEIQAHPDLGKVADYVLPAATTLDGLAAGRIVVYSTAGERLTNVTGVYREVAPLRLKQREPRRVDAGSAMQENLFGNGWYPRDGTFRWMAKHSTVRIGGPQNATERLYISGYCPAAQRNSGPLPLIVRADHRLLEPAQIAPGTERFDLSFTLPPELAGRDSIELEIEVGRTIRPPDDGRELGLVFGVFEIR